MASIRENHLSNGETTWTVLYRHRDRQTSDTFADRSAAEKFQQLVPLLGPERALAALVEENSAPGPDVFTVADLAAKFLEWKGGKVTGRTLRDYERDVSNWILPALGHRSAEHLNEMDVQEWVDHLEVAPRKGATGAGPLEAKTIAGHHMLLHAMFDFGKARVRRLVTHNPCLETELPERRRKPPRGSTVPEFTALLAAARARNPDAHDLVLYLGETGWRFSEATALHVDDIEDDGDDVWTNVNRVFRTDQSGRRFLAQDEAKSYAAFRRIRMFPTTAAMLRRRLVGLGPGDLVFVNSRGRPWNQNTFLRETWPRIRTDAGATRLIGGKPITPHHLRHMHVAVLAASGAPLQEIQRRIGHESIATTINTYGGMIGDISDDALARGADIMAGRRFAAGVAPAVRGQVVEPTVVAGELVPSPGGSASTPG